MADPRLSYRFKPIPPRPLTDKEEEWLNRRNRIGADDERRHDIELTANKEDDPMTISESVIALATAGAEQAQPMSDLERAARAIVTRLGSDPDFPAFRGPPVILGQNIYGVPRPQVQRPLWTFFTAEAEAALSVLDI